MRSCAEIGIDLPDAAGEPLGLVRQGSDGTKDAAGQIRHVIAVEALSRVGHREPGLPFEVLAQCFGEWSRIGLVRICKADSTRSGSYSNRAQATSPT